MNISDDHKQRMLESEKMAILGKLTASIAHEILNPLTILSGRVDALKRKIELQSVNYHQIIQELEKVESVAQRINQVIQGVRSYSRNSENDPKTIHSLCEIITNSIALCNDSCRSAGIQLSVNINPEQRNCLIECRPSQLSQVFLNLIHNSIDAISGQADPWIEITVKIFDQEIQIEISDSGKGIPKEVEMKLFTPFYTTKPIGKGTGLGLSICQGIIQSHNGKLTYEPKEGHTCFRIVIPKKAYEDRSNKL